MFSEYMDVEKPLDSMAKKDEDKADDNENKSIHDDKGEKEWNGKNKYEQGKILETKNQINKRVTFLTNTDPNNLNPKEKQYPSVVNAFAESMEAGIGKIDEKKIPGFHKVLGDGREVEVKSGEDSFSLNIIKKGNDGKQENLHIELSNFRNGANESNNGEIKKQINSMPKVRIIGDIKLLDKNLQDSNDIPKIVNSIESIIMREEREDVDGFKDRQERQDKEFHEKKQNDYELLLLELNPEIDGKLPMTNEDIANHMINGFKNNEGEYLPARKTFLALCILLRGGNNVQEIKDKIVENEKIDNHKEITIKNPDSGENVMEYVSDNTLDLNFLIDNEDKIINLAKQSNKISSIELAFLNS